MKALLSTLLIFSLFIGSAQPTDTSTQKKSKGLVVLPIVFYSPETNLGFGAGSLIYFRPGKSADTTSRPSNLQNLLIYTLEKQILFNNLYNIFTDQERYWLKGEASFYIYPYEYYGIGSDISLAQPELYTADFIRIETNALRKIKKGLYLGGTIFFDNYFRIEAEEGGMLTNSNVRGLNPGTLFGYGLSGILDKRNNIFSPSSGYYLETRFLHYEQQAIGDYRFNDLFLDVRKYFHLLKEWETSLQFYHQSVIGSPPFYNLALLGGGKLMRGYYRGAYRDHHQTVLQAEIRHYLFGPLMISAFGGAGAVTPKIGDFDKVLGSYGMGIRYELNKNEHIRIRLDYARGLHTSGFYLNINEAF